MVLTALGIGNAAYETGNILGAIIKGLFIPKIPPGSVLMVAGLVGEYRNHLLLNIISGMVVLVAVFLGLRSLLNVFGFI